MSIHSMATHPPQYAADPLNVDLGLSCDAYNVTDMVMKARAIRSFDGAAVRYPIHRSVRCAARRRLEDVFDDLALNSGYKALRLDEGDLLLETPDAFVHASGSRKAEYCSCQFDIWTTSRERLEQLRDQLFAIVGARYAREQMFTIDWHFMHARHGLRSATFDELALDSIHDEAYPTLGVSVDTFAQRYLDANETVLILQGPPGTGKTRLVRAILSAISARKAEDSAQIMYTADKLALERDEIFVSFITGEHDAFVIEDADHLLLARSNGNHDLHRFLAIADGIVRAQGRKIIFTTNLPNVSDLDDALLRPGRCFANVRTRGLSRNEAAALLVRLMDDEARREQVLDAAFLSSSSVTVANLYQACKSI
jgi:ATPase family associated with various cellular activities (AAA)